MQEIFRTNYQEYKQQENTDKNGNRKAVTNLDEISMGIKWKIAQNCLMKENSANIYEIY